jgi:folate-binding protein YgfZ
VIFHVNLDRRLLRLSGRDVVSYLHTKLTVDVRPWPRTGGAYAYAVDINGRIIFDADFSMQPDGQVLAWLRTDRTAAAIAHLDRYVIREDVVLTDVSDGWTVLELLDDGTAPPQSRAGSTRTVGGVECLSTPWFFAGRSGELLAVPTNDLDAVTSELLGTGSVKLDDSAWDTMRLDHAQPVVGRELLVEENIPLEAGEDGVQFNKGCYLGQEVIERLSARGTPARRLAVIVWDGAGVPSGTPILLGESEVGQVVTPDPDPTVARGFAWIRRKGLSAADELRINGSPLRLRLVGGE